MKKYLAIILISLCLLLILGFVGCSNKVGPGAPAGIAWNNLIYGPSGTEVSQSELGKQLGEINRINKPMPVQNGDSNYAPVGSKIYQIEGIDINTSIVIETEGKYYKYVKNDSLNK